MNRVWKVVRHYLQAVREVFLIFMEGILSQEIERYGLARDFFKESIHLGDELRLLTHFHDGCGLSRAEWFERFGLHTERGYRFFARRFRFQGDRIEVLVAIAEDDGVWISSEHLERTTTLWNEHWRIPFRHDYGF